MDFLFAHVPAPAGQPADDRGAWMLRHHADRVRLWRDPASGTVLAAVHGEGAVPDAVSLAVSGQVAVLADASLYYRADLLRALRAAGQAPAPEASPAALVAAAYLAWGERFLDHLEGDFAVVVWDGRTRTLVLGRDFSGGRPLFHAVPRAGGVAAASRIEPLLTLAGVDASLDPLALAQHASWIFPDQERSVHRGVRRVAPGGVLVLDGATARVRARRGWTPPIFERAAGALPFDDAAAELRRLLRESVAERVAAVGETAVWMSGGYDSTAVFAAGRDAGFDALRPVSVSYPAGDSGREDEAIALVASRWDAAVSWLDSADVELFSRLEVQAAASEEPFLHLYADFHAALARVSAGLGARVALGGYGGDQLFWASNTYLADLLVHGRLRTLRGEVRRLGLGLSGAWDAIVKPLVPASLLGVASRFAGDRFRPALDRVVPAWLVPATTREAGLDRAFRRAHPRRAGESRSAYDSYYSLANPFFSRVLETTAGVAREHGVEHRSPIFDRRVVEFAATRPRWERASGGEQKRLLRHAMKPLLPASILARRPYKTGTARDMFARAVRRRLPELLAQLTRAPMLADLGVIDADALRRAAARFVASGDPLEGGALIPTVQTELWLRGEAARAAARSTAGSRARLGVEERADSVLEVSCA